MRHLRLRLPIVLAPVLVLAACSSELTSDGYVSGHPSGHGGMAPGAGALPGETYASTEENDFVETATEPLSTFAIDVDTGSYSLMRRDVEAGRLPNQDGVRPEEYVNYFSYDYSPPTDGSAFSVHLDGAPSKFGDDLHLVRVGLQGKIIDPAQRKHANLVFLVDVSGSMATPNKLPLVQYSLKQLVKRLEPTDTLSIVTYAGSERVALAPTAVKDKGAILDAIDGLTAGGGTNGEGGIRKAYELAEQAKRDGGINRVVLCSDGDFNVGVTGDALIALIEEKRDTGISLTTLGFGQGNYNDRDMERLADHGNGNYAYIDNAGEANRVLGEKLVSTLQVIAKDVKIQIEFQPELVSRYRLVGYDNRVMANEDFRDDTKDAGELGAGHSVTAFYEVQLTEAASQSQGALATVRLRYKQPDGDQASELELPFPRAALAPTFDAAAPDLRFAAAVTEYAEILRRSKHSEGARFEETLTIATATAGAHEDRRELVTLMGKAAGLWQ